MTPAPFITRPLSVWLDLVRGLAALAVVVGHAVQLRVYTGWFPFTIFFQKNAVVVFFVLSGMVIAASVDRDRKTPNGRTLGAFALARVSRIVPVAWAAIALSLAVAALDVSLSETPAFLEDLKWTDRSDTLLAALFMTESLGERFHPNAPYWSLCYEAWFYALFAAATYLTGRKRALWLVILGAVAGLNILLLLPTWLIGAGLVRLPAARRVPLGLACIFVAVAAAALLLLPLVAMDGYRWLESVVPWLLGHSLYTLTDFGIGLAVAAGFAGLRTLTERGMTLPARAEPAIRWGANMSFSLYLTHWPLIKLVTIAGLTAGNNPLAFAAVIAGIVTASGAFAAVTEHKRQAVRNWLERMLRRPAPIQTTTSA